MSNDMLLSVDDLAQEIRRVDGWHSLGAGALAEALMPFIEQAVLQSDEVQVWKKDAERLKKACRIAVLALAHAHKEHGEVYRLAYKEVDAAIQETQP